jgi:hypothetical protein
MSGYEAKQSNVSASLDIGLATKISTEAGSDLVFFTLRIWVSVLQHEKL